jgi:hypothetical protein
MPRKRARRSEHTAPATGGGESASFDEYVERENARARLAPPSPAFNVARRQRITAAIRAMLRDSGRERESPDAIVAEIERHAAAFTQPPGERYVGPFRLFRDVKRAADNLREALANLIRRTAPETGDWDYSRFLRESSPQEGERGAVTRTDPQAPSMEADRLHSVLSLGAGRVGSGNSGTRIPGILALSLTP